MSSLASPLISVYMPTRNRREQMQRAVQSILEQTHPSFEVVVVDDASSDDTADCLAQWAAREPRLRWFRQDVSSGAPAARNRAIREARGQFVTGLDDDDVFLPERLAAFAQAWGTLIPDGQPAFLYAQTKLLQARGETFSNRPPQLTWSALCKGNCVGNQIYAPRELLLSVGGYREGLPAWQDLDLWLTLLGAGAVGRLVDQVTMVVDSRPRADRITRQDRARIEFARDEVLERHGPALTHSQRRDLYLQALGRHYGFRLRWSDVRGAWRLDPSYGTVRRLLSIAWRVIRGR